MSPPLDWGSSRERLCFFRVMLPDLGLCLPSDWRSFRTGLGLPSESGSLKECCISPSLWLLKGRAGFPQSELPERGLYFPLRLWFFESKAAFPHSGAP